MTYAIAVVLLAATILCAMLSAPIWVTLPVALVSCALSLRTLFERPREPH